MEEIWAEHHGLIKLVAALVVVAWIANKLLRRGRHDYSKRPVTVFCNHCNWKGKVPPGRQACGKCKSTNVTVHSL